MKLTIISPENIVYDGDADNVSVPGSKGAFEILRGHAPIISSLQSGTIKYKTDSDQTLEIKSGFVEVANDKIVACVETK